VHENADLRVKALEKLYSLLKEKSSEIIYLIERQENMEIISDIVCALLNGCRDSDHRVKILCGSCLGEIGAIDPANIMLNLGTMNTNAPSLNAALNNKKQDNINNINNSKLNNSLTSQSKTIMSSTDLLMNPSLVSDDSNEFSENFSYSLIIELSKAYLAARNTHEQDSASYAIQECLKVYGCSLTSNNNNNSITTSSLSTTKAQNSKLWNMFPDYFKEILIPLQTSKYEIQSFDNLGSLKTPLILSGECKTYEDWVYKWVIYLISKIDTHFRYNISFFLLIEI
jgi:serine/threonine-protein kinase ATR